MNDHELLAQPLTLPCGATLRNRVLKSAMSETLGTPTHGPQPGLAKLYRTWAHGGTGLLISGNVMIDRRALGEPGNVVIEDERDLKALSEWASAGTENGTHFWMQLNHPGKQSPKFLSAQTVSPSAIPFGPALSGAFSVPRELTQAEIHDLIERFGRSAGVAKKAGFTGVQIHGAHGYLVSQFLSPHHNQRTDHWGGSLQNRSRFVLEIYDAIRAQVGPGFPVSIKLNSADFQRGGFDNDDSIQVMKKLEERGIDLIEVSGGTYEAPAMTGARASTIAREGYFLDFIGKAREHLSVPLCVTGGFRTAHGMAGALRERADLVGLARSLAIEPDFVARVLAGEDPTSKVTSHSTGVRRIDRLAMFDVTWYENQLARMAAGKAPRIALSPWTSLAMTMTRTGLQSFRKRRS